MHETSWYRFFARRRRRGLVARLILLGSAAYVLVPLARLQIQETAAFELQARQNRLRPLAVPAPRGTIYDRDGRVVAESVVGYKVLLMPAEEDVLRDRLERLRPVLQLSDGDIALALRRFRRSPHLPMEVLRDASPVQVSRLEERRYLFPSVLVETYAKRHYPAGQAVAHFIGYVSEISEAELGQRAFSEYTQGRWIGKAGLERQYETWLGGTPGVQYLEVDARARIKRWATGLGVAPVPGQDLRLHLDLGLQEHIARIFPKDQTGAIVALDPRTGGVLAYYSHPTYDPNRFVGGVPTDLWQALQADARKPLLDRVVASGQPAASTWKLAVAGMALDLDAIRPDEVMPIPCTGGMTWGRYARCWYKPGHGRLNLIEGIKNSCNVYFYQVGIRIGFDRFLETGARLGFDSKTGVDLPHEIKPNFPTSRAYWSRRFGYEPRQTEVLSLAIGQGPLTMTVLKLAQVYAALAMPDGRVPAPQLAADFGAPADTFQFNLDRRDVWFLEAGMRRVVGPGGTAALSRLKDWDFIGKTGTAQNPHGKDHAWFVGTGSSTLGGEPEIAVTMFLEAAEHGYTASGYVAEAVAFYLNKKHGRPQPEGGWATPRHRLANGLPIDWNWSSPVVDPPMPEGGGIPVMAAEAPAVRPAATAPAPVASQASTRPRLEP